MQIKISFGFSILALVAPAIVLGQGNRPLIVQPATVIEQGPHQRTWQYVSLDDIGGELVEQTHSYIELGSGLNVWSPAENKWSEASDEIELFPNGAIARKAQHKVIFAPNLNDQAGTIDLSMHDGRRLRSQVIGMAYTDVTTGQSVFVAEMKDSAGVLVGRNQVVYADAFDALRADVRYTMTMATFEQDVILKQQLPPPAQYGFASADSLQVEIWTEFLEAPQPNKRALRQTNNPLEADEQLDFGPTGMFFGVSEVFRLPDNGNQPLAVLTDKRAVRATKQWTRLNGLTFLIEAVPFRGLEQLLDGLPPAQAQLPPDAGKLKRLAATSGTRERQKPISLADATTRPDRKSIGSLAQARLRRGTAAQEPGVVFDYTTANGGTDFVFASDTTYYVSANAYFYGTTKVEGGAIIKYAPIDPNLNGTPRILVLGGLNCTTQPYRPAICTARDDDSVGEIISGSTGNPGTNYYAFQAFLIWDSGSAVSAHDLRISHAYYGFGAQYRQNVELGNAQVIHSCYGAGSYVGSFATRNVLLQNFVYGLAAGGGAAIIGENLTLSQGTQAILNDSGTFALTNCLVVAVGTTNGISGSHNEIVSSTNGVFQSVGGGNHYLAADSPRRNAGSTNINATLLSELKSRTTYPPIFLTNAIQVNTLLSPQAQRDTDLPDLGYHYDPLDYLAQEVAVTNAVLTLTNGVVVGTQGTNGFRLYAGGTLNSQGTPLNLNRIVRARSVHENSVVTNNFTFVSVKYAEAASPSPTLLARFTRFEVSPVNATAMHSFGNFSVSTMALTLQDCQVYGGRIQVKNGVGLTGQCQNNLFERVLAQLKGKTFSHFNNLHLAGSLTFYVDGDTTCTAKDNFFDQTTLSTISGGGTTDFGFNGYITNYTRLSPEGVSNVTFQASFAYDTGALGSYYLPGGNGLIDKGSRSAASAGLYHHTTQTGQTKESTSTVDIGFHYVALNGQGQGVDTDGDGWLDYWEDSNGNGEFDSGNGETNWQNSDSPVGSASGLIVFTPLK